MVDKIFEGVFVLVGESGFAKASLVVAAAACSRVLEQSTFGVESDDSRGSTPACAIWPCRRVDRVECFDINLQIAVRQAYTVQRYHLLEDPTDDTHLPYPEAAEPVAIYPPRTKQSDIQTTYPASTTTSSLQST